LREKSGGSPISDKIENIVGPTASFSGDLKCDGGVRIDGVYRGSVETMGNVIIGEAAKVVADITGRNISVAGAVRGNIKASGRLEILSTGQVWGDISVDSFLIDEGGFFNGSSTMRGEMEPILMEEPPRTEKVD